MPLPYIAWRDYYSVGDASLDAEHRKIIAIVNELYEASQRGTDHQQMKSLLDRLVEYTTTHFEHEERIMQEHGYPDLASHKAAHDGMTQRTLELRQGFGTVTAQELLHFLKEWWLGHIQGKDKEYTPYLGVGVSR